MDIWYFMNMDGYLKYCVKPELLTLGYFTFTMNITSWKHNIECNFH